MHPISFVLLIPTGELLTRIADGHADPNEWGGFYQQTLWTAVAAVVDPNRRLVNGTALEHGLWARVADVSPEVAATMPALYPPNPAATAP